jgi:hypothetical protein
MIFEEKQRFKQWWMILLMGGVSAMVYYGSVSQWITGVPFGDKPLSDMGLLFPVVLISIVNLGMFAGGLTTKIDEQGIVVRFTPFIWKEKKYDWSDLAEVKVREYRPLAEYGGWGVRGFGKNRALNVSGNFGLQLVMKDGSRMLIGSQRPQELEDFLKNLAAAKGILTV